MLEKLELAKNPNHQLSCSLNPVLSCGPVINSDAATTFGIPNPILGLINFGATLAIGMGLLAGAKYKKWFWQGLQIGSTLGMILVLWFIYHSLYSIGALCIYCMITWSITWPMFWYITVYNISQQNINIKNKAVSSFITKHHLDILISFYVFVIALIGFRFWDYWQTLL